MTDWIDEARDSQLVAGVSTRLQAAGLLILRHGLVLILVVFGLQKWTLAEAEGIRPWISSSPFLGWLYRIASVQGVSIFFGITELVTAILISVRRWFPFVSALGSAGAILMFITTLSFLVTTPHQDANAQGFLIKDVFLLGASVWSCGEALIASRVSSRK